MRPVQSPLKMTERKRLTQKRALSAISKSPRRRLVYLQEADRLWSLAVRMRDKFTCQRCGRLGNQPHHIFSRAIRHLRHDLGNGICLCAGCHTLGTESAHKGPEAFRDWLIRFKGQAWFVALKQHAAMIQKPDYSMRILELKAILKGMEGC